MPMYFGVTQFPGDFWVKLDGSVDVYDELVVSDWFYVPLKKNNKIKLKGLTLIVRDEYSWIFM